MAIQKTPGIWEDIPKNALVRAERNGTVLVGTLIEVAGRNGDKYMDVDSFPPYTTRLYARDGWEVTYEDRSFADILASVPVGSVFRSDYVRIVKVSKFNVTREDSESEGYDVPPTLVRISEFQNIPSTTYKRVAYI